MTQGGQSGAVPNKRKARPGYVRPSAPSAPPSEWEDDGASRGAMDRYDTLSDASGSINISQYGRSTTGSVYADNISVLSDYSDSATNSTAGGPHTLNSLRTRANNNNTNTNNTNNGARMGGAQAPDSNQTSFQIPSDASSSQYSIPAPASAQHSNYSLELASRQSQEERLRDNEFWKVEVTYMYVPLKPLNALNVVGSVGYAWLCLVGFVAWLWFMGAFAATNDTRYGLMVTLWIVSMVWALLGLGFGANYLIRNKWCTPRHNWDVIGSIVAIFLMLLAGSIFFTIVAAKYTDIRSFHENESHKEHEQLEELELSSDSHWCEQKKIRAGLAFYISLLFLAIGPIVVLPYQARAWTAHRYPECSSNVTDFFQYKRKYLTSMQQRYGLPQSPDNFTLL